jgi:hypothetical protein
MEKQLLKNLKVDNKIKINICEDRDSITSKFLNTLGESGLNKLLGIMNWI